MKNKKLCSNAGITEKCVCHCYITKYPIKNTLNFNCYFLRKTHSTEQTPFASMSPPDTHQSAQTTEIKCHAQWHNTLVELRIWTTEPLNDKAPHGLYHWGVSFPYGGYLREARVWHLTAYRGSTPDFSLRLSPEVFSTRGNFRKTTEVCN